MALASGRSMWERGSPEDLSVVRVIYRNICARGPHAPCFADVYSAAGWGLVGAPMRCPCGSDSCDISPTLSMTWLLSVRVSTGSARYIQNT